MKYTKEDLTKLESLVKQINELLSTKFDCCQINVKQPRKTEINVDIYERVSSSSLSSVDG